MTVLKIMKHQIYEHSSFIKSTARQLNADTCDLYKLESWALPKIRYNGLPCTHIKLEIMTDQ